LKKILLVGNPNVGKSVIFSKLTGVNVAVSNFPGTTVEFSKGRSRIGSEEVEIIDVPGAYGLEPTNKAEEVAVEMLSDGDVVINVVDATNLERNLYLTLQLLERDIPVVIALNLWDETKHKGIEIDVDKLSELLGVPTITTNARSGFGLNSLMMSIRKARSPELAPEDAPTRWVRIGEITRSVQRITHHHHTFVEWLQDASIHPVGGFFVAGLVIVAMFGLIRLMGEAIIRYIMDPVFEGLYMPLLRALNGRIISEPILHNILIGKLIHGEIDFIQSFGLLTTGLYVPIGMVLPYVFSFYLLLGLIEDIGYLPRLAVMMDGFMHRLGLHGYAVIPSLLGLGCNVPALLATRILDSRRERFIVATLISIGVPCVALQAMIVGLLGPYGMRYVALVYLVLFLVWVGLGLLMRLFTRGFLPGLLIEIPPYRVPYMRTLMMKFKMRTLGFLKEALPVVIIGVAAVNLLYAVGVLHALARVTSPVVTRLLGLPEDAVLAVIIGFLRKDIGVGMMAPLGMTVKQLVIGSTTLAMFFPCVATFVVMFKELGTLDTVKSIGIMVTTAIGVGALLNLILR
jgi:ferrous iron transport protein B